MQLIRCSTYHRAHDKVIPAQGRAIVPTDLAMAIPVGHYGTLTPARLDAETAMCRAKSQPCTSAHVGLLQGGLRPAADLL